MTIGVKESSNGFVFLANPDSISKAIRHGLLKSLLSSPTHRLSPKSDYPLVDTPKTPFTISVFQNERGEEVGELRRRDSEHNGVIQIVDEKNPVELLFTPEGKRLGFSGCVFYVPDGVQKDAELYFQYYLANLKPNQIVDYPAEHDKVSVFHQLTDPKNSPAYEALVLTAAWAGETSHQVPAQAINNIFFFGKDHSSPLWSGTKRTMYSYEGNVEPNTKIKYSFEFDSQMKVDQLHMVVTQSTEDHQRVLTIHYPYEVSAVRTPIVTIKTENRITLLDLCRMEIPNTPPVVNAGWLVRELQAFGINRPLVLPNRLST